MIFRRMAIILLSLLILLSGCSSNTAKDIENSEKGKHANIHTGEDLNRKNEEGDYLVSDDYPIEQNISESDKVETEGNVTVNGKDEATEEKNEDGSENDSII
jgi:uncharacterized protein YceK